MIRLQQSHWPDEYKEALSSIDVLIQEIMIFPDGFCAVFNAKGDQLSQYQGFWDDVGSKLMQAAPDSAKISIAFKPAAIELQNAHRGWQLEFHI